MQSHEKFILSMGYFALSTPGDCILLGTKVFSPQVLPRAFRKYFPIGHGPDL